MTSRLGTLPLFATDKELGPAIMPKGREKEWPAIARDLEKLGFPQIDPIFGGRYVAAVEAYFDARAGLREDFVRAAPEERKTWDDIWARRRQPKGGARK